MEYDDGLNFIVRWMTSDSEEEHTQFATLEHAKKLYSGLLASPRVVMCSYERRQPWHKEE